MTTFNRTNRASTLTALSNDQIKLKAPSIFAERPMTGVSDRYSFLPTYQVVEAMRENGWAPVMVSEQRVNVEHRIGFQKHMIRFQRQDQVAFQVGEYKPEIVLVNSHDRSSAYNIHAGLFRLICSNGMVVADSTFARVSLRHNGFNPAQVVEASSEILNEVPKLVESVESFKARILTPAEAKAFAEGAILLRYDDLETAPVSAEKLLDNRRTADAGMDLWKTFNRVQENVINGGQKDWGRRNANGRRMPKTRAVTSLDGNIKLNKALWHMAEALRTGNFSNTVTE